jgi:hypothetical protein
MCALVTSLTDTIDTLPSFLAEVDGSRPQLAGDEEMTPQPRIIQTVFVFSSRLEAVLDSFAIVLVCAARIRCAEPE